MSEQQGTRTEALIAAIRGRITSRTLLPGDRVPSIRRFAATMRVSPSTVVEAYDRLVAEGVLHARRGSGFYVAQAGAAPMVLADMAPHGDRAVDPFWVARQSLDADLRMEKPGCGWLPPGWMPGAALRRSLRDAARGGDALLAEYGGTRGPAALRRLLLGRFAEEGIETTPTQLMLTGSGTQAIDLICRFLLRPGDTVLIDDPCYFNFQSLLRAHQATIASVPYTANGPDIAAFEAIVAEARPRLYITNSAVHNPTGASLAPQTAYRLLRAAVAHDMIVVEDDIFADFEPTPSPRLAVLDGLDRVIRIGSFSKTLSASLRCGYIAARADWIEALIDLQVATSFSGPSPIAAEVIAAVLAGGGYRKHMAELRARLARARDDLATKLAPRGIEPWIMPRGGFHLWCHVPPGCDAVDLARRCLAQGVVLAPGNVFSVAQSAGGFMRFNVTQTSARALAVIDRHLG